MTEAPTALLLDEQNSATSHSAEPTVDGKGNSSVVTVDHVAGATPPSTMLALIDRYVCDPTVDVGKFERLLAMKERMDAHEARRQYYEAMNLAQNEIQPVARTAYNDHTKSWFAKLEAVDAAIRPIYLRHGFSISRNTIAPLVAGNIRIEVQCSHLGGHIEKFHREAPPDTVGPAGKGNKTMLHGGGSSETYLTRYTVCGIFNVVFKDQDNDGNNQYLDELQIATIVDLMAKAKVGPKFLHYMNALSVEEAGSVEAAVGTISGRSYQKALSTLNEQIQKQGRGTEEKIP